MNIALDKDGKFKILMEKKGRKINIEASELIKYAFQIQNEIENKVIIFLL